MSRFKYFCFKLQQLIELIREKKTEEALEFAQTQLSERGEDSPECLGDMERALALLAFDKPEDSPFSDLLLSSQRHKVGKCWYYIYFRFDAVLMILREQDFSALQLRLCQFRAGHFGAGATRFSSFLMYIILLFVLFKKSF